MHPWYPPARRCPLTSLAVALSLLSPAQVLAGNGAELLTVQPASAGTTQALVLPTNPQLQQELAAGLSADRLRVVVPHGQGRVTSVQRLVELRAPVHTVLAIDGTGSFAPYWRQALGLAAAFGDALPDAHPQTVHVVIFGLSLEDAGTATSAQDLRVLLQAVAKHPRAQAVTRLKAFVRESVRLAAAGQPASAQGIRQVIVLTDGDDESSAYGPSDLVAEAQAAGVQIHTVAFYRAGKQSPALARRMDELKQLSDGTGGRNIQVDDLSSAETALRSLATAPLDAFWARLEFCGLADVGSTRFEEPLSIEFLRDGNRVAFTGPLTFRQDASGAAAEPCQNCQPACGPGFACVNGSCTSSPLSQAPGTRAPAAAAARRGLSWLWWILPFALLFGFLVLRRRRAPDSGIPSQPPEPEPVPAPPTSPVSKALQYEARPWDDPFKALPFRRLVAVGLLPGVPSAITLGGRLVLGADSSRSDLVLDVSQVSGRHAQVDLASDGTVTVTDLASTNGTWVDQMRLAANQSSVVRPGQVIAFSRKVLFRLEGDQGAPPTSPSFPSGPDSHSPAGGEPASPARKAATIYHPIKKGDA